MRFEGVLALIRMPIVSESMRRKLLVGVLGEIEEIQV